MPLTDFQRELCTTSRWDFSDLKALYLTCTLKRPRELSHSEGLIRISMTWNLLHSARLLMDTGGFPAHGSQRSLSDAGCRSDFANPDYR